MKRLRISLLSVIALAIGFFAYTAFWGEKEAEGENSDIKTETSKIDAETLIETGAPLDKSFKFSFSNELDKATMTNETIKVLNEEQEEAAIGIELSDDGKTMEISAPKEKYKKGAVYELQILEGVKYKNGDPVRDTYNMQFITARDEVEKVEWNENLVFVKQEQVEVFEEKEVIVDKSIKPDLAVDDIIILPSKEHPEGQALKVLEIEEEKGLFHLLVEKPDFAELFNELDIYKSYEIKKEHIEIEEGIEGLAVTDFAGKNLNTMLASSNGGGMSFEYKAPAPVKGMESVVGIEFTFNDMPLGKDKDSPTLDGSISYQNAIAATDMRLGTGTRYQLSNINSSVNKFVISPPAVKGKGEKISEKKNKDFKKTDEKIKLAKLKVPTTAPGLFVTGAFYLKVDYSFSYQPEVTVVFETEEERGVIYDGQTVKQINKFVPELDASLKGTGTVETIAGAAVSVSVTAYGVTGVGVEAFGGTKGNGEFLTGINKEYGAYSCYEAAFNPVLQGNLFVDVLGKKLYNWNLAKVNLNPKIIQGNCDVFQELEVKKKQAEILAGETMDIPLKGIYTNLKNKKSRTLNLKDSKNLKVESADEQVVKASLKNGILVLAAADTPAKESSTVTIEYEEKSEAFEKAVVSKIEIPVTIENFKKVKVESLSKEEYLAIGKETMDRILSILDETGEKHGLYNEVPGKYNLMEAELSTFITDQLVERKMREYVETEYYCDCDLNNYPRIVDSMIRVKVEAVDQETFKVEGILLGDYHNGTRKQTLEFKKEGLEWKLSDWVDESLENMDLKLLEEEVRIGYAFSQSEEIVGEYTSSDSGGPAYMIAVDGNINYGIDKRNGNMLFDVPLQEEAEEQNEQNLDAGITQEDAEMLVREYLDLGPDTIQNFVYEMDNELGDYVIHVYENVVDDPISGASHTATYGWYGVDPETGEVYDEMMRSSY